VVVIGGGPGGYSAAIRAGQIGLKTVLIEKDELGGVCLNVGCIPTKAFVKCASQVKSIEKLSELGISATYHGLDLKKFQAKKNATVSKLTGGVGFLLNSAKVDVVKGEAVFADNETLAVKTAQGERRYKARNYIIAVGTRPRPLDILPFDGKTVVSSTDALNWDTLPKRLAVIGAGVVGMEFASIFSRLGVEVTVLEVLPKILPMEDADVVAHLQKSMERQGVKFFTGAKILSAARKTGAVTLEIKTAGKKNIVTTDKVLVAVGRQTNVDTLNLASTNVKTDMGYIMVDAGMRTNVPFIYAVGDVTPSWQLAHVAYEEGYIAAENIAGEKKTMSYEVVPRCIYTTPEVSAVGLTEEQAKAKHKNAKAYTFPFSAVGKALIESGGDGFAKIIVDEQYGEILGYSMVGAGVGELIAAPAVAMSLEATAESLSEVITPHPSLSEIVKETALMAVGKPLHMNRK